MTSKCLTERQNISSFALNRTFFFWRKQQQHLPQHTAFAAFPPTEERSVALRMSLACGSGNCCPSLWQADHWFFSQSSAPWPLELVLAKEDIKVFNETLAELLQRQRVDRDGSCLPPPPRVIAGTASLSGCARGLLCRFESFRNCLRHLPTLSRES